MGATRDGRITATTATLIYEAGAFPGSPINPGTQCMFGPYDIANGRVVGYDVVINAPKTAAYRAPGAPAAAYAAESVIDELAEKLNLDPIDFRMRNGAKEGTRRLTGPVFPRIGYLETLQAAKDHPHYSAPLSGAESRARDSRRLLVQWLRAFQRHGQRRPGRDGQPY